MIEIGNKWRVSVMDGGTGQVCEKIIVIPGQATNMLQSLEEVTKDMVPNSISELHVTYLETVNIIKE